MAGDLKLLPKEKESPLKQTQHVLICFRRLFQRVPWGAPKQALFNFKTPKSQKSILAGRDVCADFLFLKTGAYWSDGKTMTG